MLCAGHLVAEMTHLWSPYICIEEERTLSFLNIHLQNPHLKNSIYTVMKTIGF